MSHPSKVVVERHPEGYVAYPLGLRGIVVGEGDTAAEALADVTSAIHFHIETFGQEAFDAESMVLEAYVVETALAISCLISRPMLRKHGFCALSLCWGFVLLARGTTSRLCMKIPTPHGHR